MIKSVIRIQVKQVAYCSNFLKLIITYIPHPTEYDESEDLEYQKKFMNKLIDTKFARK